MRESKRDVILEAAQRVVQRDGVTALSYEAVAAEAGLTKGGLVYHFPSREDLLLALHEYVAGHWEQALRREAGQESTAELDPQEWAGAYVRANGIPDRAELLLMLEATEDPAAHAVWNGVHDRWAAPPPRDENDAAGERLFLARLAADGLWFYEALAGQPLPEKLRERLQQQIIALGGR